MPHQAHPAALLSCLGFPGWGPLHLQLGTRPDPAILARQLRTLHTAGLAAFLRQSNDLQPLRLPLPLLLAQLAAPIPHLRLLHRPCGPQRLWIDLHPFGPGAGRPLHGPVSLAVALRSHRPEVAQVSQMSQDLPQGWTQCGSVQD